MPDAPCFTPGASLSSCPCLFLLGSGGTWDAIVPGAPRLRAHLSFSHPRFFLSGQRWWCLRRCSAWDAVGLGRPQMPKPGCSSAVALNVVLISSAWLGGRCLWRSKPTPSLQCTLLSALQLLGRLLAFAGSSSYLQLPCPPSITPAPLSACRACSSSLMSESSGPMTSMSRASRLAAS